MSVAKGAVRQNYSVRTTIAFEDEFGNQRTPRTLLASIQPAPEQSFSVAELTAELSVGATESIAAQIVNTGSDTVQDAVVVLQTQGTNLAPKAEEYPIGDIASGQRNAVKFTIEAPETASPGARRLAFFVRYENQAGDSFESEPLGFRVNVSDRQPAFTFKPIDTEFAVDSVGRLQIDLTNNLDEPITDLTASLSVVDPLDSEDSSTFIASLAPGETARISFHIDIGSDAIPKTHLIEVELSYRDAAGTLNTDGPYRIGIDVTEEPGPDFPAIPIAVGALSILLGMGWWYLRR